MNKMTEFRNALREAWAYIKVYFQLRWDALRLRYAIFMADALQKAKNKRFYVIENAQGKLIWLCNDDIKIMQRPRVVRKLVNGKLFYYKMRMIPKGTTHLDVMRDCLYYTDVRINNSNGITVEERNKKQAAWLSYMEKKRMDKMFGKLKAKK